MKHQAKTFCFEDLIKKNEQKFENFKEIKEKSLTIKKNLKWKNGKNLLQSISSIKYIFGGIHSPPSPPAPLPSPSSPSPPSSSSHRK